MFAQVNPAVDAGAPIFLFVQYEIEGSVELSFLRDLQRYEAVKILAKSAKSSEVKQMFEMWVVEIVVNILYECW